MAYIHKAEIIFIDANEEFESVRDIVEELNNSDYLPNAKLISGETKEFEWDDNVVVNRIDATSEQCLEFFNNPPSKIVLPTYNYIVYVDPINNRSHITMVEASEHPNMHNYINKSPAGTYTIYIEDVENEYEAINRAEYIIMQDINKNKEKISTVLSKAKLVNK